MPGRRDDDVIGEAHLESLAQLRNSPREFTITSGRLQRPARVVVSEDNRRCTHSESSCEKLARVQGGTRDGPVAEMLSRQNTPLSIEEDRRERLDVFKRKRRTEPRDQFFDIVDALLLGFLRLKDLGDYAHCAIAIGPEQLRQSGCQSHGSKISDFPIPSPGAHNRGHQAFTQKKRKPEATTAEPAMAERAETACWKS